MCTTIPEQMLRTGPSATKSREATAASCFLWRRHNQSHRGRYAPRQQRVLQRICQKRHGYKRTWARASVCPRFRITDYPWVSPTDPATDLRRANAKNKRKASGRREPGAFSSVIHRVTRVSYVPRPSRRNPHLIRSAAASAFVTPAWTPNAFIFSAILPLADLMHQAGCPAVRGRRHVPRPWVFQAVLNSLISTRSRSTQISTDRPRATLDRVADKNRDSLSSLHRPVQFNFGFAGALRAHRLQRRFIRPRIVLTVEPT